MPKADEIDIVTRLRKMADVENTDYTYAALAAEALKAAALIERLRSLSPCEGWKPMESAPKDGTPVLLYRFCDPWHVRGWGYWVNVRGIDGWLSHGFFDPPGCLGLSHPTHWAPLNFPASPSPPVG